MKKEFETEKHTDRSLTAPDELAELATLYDHYGVLMKDNKRDIFEAYVLDNLSLAEIAAENSMTRQGVYDVINRSRKKLREYEEKLHLIERDKKMRELIRTVSMDDDDRERLLRVIDEQ